MKDIEIVDNLEWSFSFGKYQGKNLMEAIEESPSIFSSGIVDINGVRQWKGIPFINSHCVSKYLKWAESKRILSVSSEAWKQIEDYNNLFIKIESYKNGDKSITSELFNKCLKEIEIMKNKEY